MLKQLSDNPDKILSKGFNRKKVSEMIKEYRKSAQANGSLKYAHFTGYEIMQLFIANGILDQTATVESQLKKLENFGLKIYLAKHLDDTAQSDDYKGRVTTVLCNTRIEPDHFYDILDDAKFMSVGDVDVDGGQGLDQAEISPPYHQNPGDDDENEDAYYVP